MKSICKNQGGFIEEFGALILLILFLAFFLALFTVRFKASEERVSGIVYNTKNDHALNGTTTFSVRASVDTYVNQNNESSYCLPPHSPYIALVNKAAEDKNVKVVVVAKKYFAVQAPWTCKNNVTVTEEK
jgi:hypothetical protein